MIAELDDGQPSYDRGVSAYEKKSIGRLKPILQNAEPSPVIVRKMDCYVVELASSTECRSSSGSLTIICGKGALGAS